MAVFLDAIPHLLLVGTVGSNLRIQCVAVVYICSTMFYLKNHVSILEIEADAEWSGDNRSNKNGLVRAVLPCICDIMDHL